MPPPNGEVCPLYGNTVDYQRSYFARLNYTHQNPVKHGLVRVVSQYPWCSAAWFERTASAAQVKSIYRFQTDKLQLPDDYVHHA